MKPAESDTEKFYGSQLGGASLPDKTLVLTFDDGPAERTVELAQYLATEGISATFFVRGDNAARHQSTLAEVHKLGHIIGNHTYNHVQMSKTSSAVSEVSRTDKLIAPYVVDKIFLFRAPYGDWAPRVAEVLNATSLRKYVGSIFWNVGGELTYKKSSDGSKTILTAADWDCWAKKIGVEECATGYLKEARKIGKGIVLMHDVHSKTIDMVKIIVPKLKAEGFHFVRIDRVPSLAEKIKEARGNTSVASKGGESIEPGVEPSVTPQAAVGKLECPQGYELKVFASGGEYCMFTDTDGKEHILGPFTQSMISRCVSSGGGVATCQTNRWSKDLVLGLRGTGVCPDGAVQHASGYCAEGDVAFGPFPADLKAKCLAREGAKPEECESLRWKVSVLESVLSR